MLVRIALAAAAVVCIPTIAHAQAPGETPPIGAPVGPGAATDGIAPGAPVAVAPVAIAPPLAPIDIVAAQPLAERAGFSDTALVVPGNHADISARMWVGAGVFVRAAVGVGHHAELWLEASDGDVESYALGARLALARGARWQIAADGWVRQVQSNPTAAGNAFATLPAFAAVLEGSTASLGITGSVCIDVGCHVLVSVGARGVFVDPIGNGSGTMLTNTLFGSASLSAGNARWRGVVETLATPNSDGTYGSMIVAAGRFTSGSLACELGAMFGTDDQDRGATPMVGLAWRP